MKSVLYRKESNAKQGVRSVFLGKRKIIWNLVYSWQENREYNQAFTVWISIWQIVVYTWKFALSISYSFKIGTVTHEHRPSLKTAGSEVQKCVGLGVLYTSLGVLQNLSGSDHRNRCLCYSLRMFLKRKVL